MNPIFVFSFLATFAIATTVGAADMSSESSKSGKTQQGSQQDQSSRDVRGADSSKATDGSSKDCEKLPDQQAGKGAASERQGSKDMAASTQSGKMPCNDPATGGFNTPRDAGKGKMPEGGHSVP